MFVSMKLCPQTLPSGKSKNEHGAYTFILLSFPKIEEGTNA